MTKSNRFASVMLAIVAVSVVFTGCSKDTYKEDFKLALENSAKVESASATGDVSFTLIEKENPEDEAPAKEDEAPAKDGDAPSEPTPMGTVNIDGKFQDKGLTSAITTSVSMFGMPAVDQTVYMKDNISYSAIPGEERYLKQDLESTMSMSMSSILEISQKYNDKFIEDVINSDVKYEKVDGGFSAKFSIPEDTYKSLFSDVFNEIYSGDEFKEQLKAESRTSMLAMGITEEELESEELNAQIDEQVEQMAEMMKTILENLKFTKLDMECVVKDNNIVSNKTDMELDLEPIINSIASMDSSLEGMLPTGMLLAIKSDIATSDINAITEIEFPEFTQENTISTEDYLKEQVQNVPELAQTPAA